jgi:hypothetical protein
MDKISFITWMRQDKKLGKKTSQDYYYRVFRVKKSVFSNVEGLLSTKKGFLKLIKMIEKYSTTVCINKKKSDVLSGTLRSSVKKYGEFKYPLLADFYKKQLILVPPK